jgi:hypothetical protein
VDEIPPSTDDDGQQLSSTAGSQQDPEPSGSAQESSVEDAGATVCWLFALAGVPVCCC